MIAESEIRGAPVSLEAEEAVVGALLLDNTAFDRIGARLQPEHFFSQECRVIFAETVRHIMANKPVDPLILYQALNGEIDQQRLNDLAAFVPSTANLCRYAQIVIDTARSRALATAADEIRNLALDKQRDIDERIETAQASLFKLQEDAPRDQWVSAYDGLVQHAELLQDRASGAVRSWSTGLSDLDNMIEGGMRPGSLVAIGARPSHGKTALGMGVGLHMARERSVALMSMEMSHQDVRDRIVAMLGQVSLSSVIRADDGLDQKRLTRAIEIAESLRFHVTDQPGMNITQVRAKVRRLKRQHGLDVLILDYIGLMSGLDTKSSRAYQIEEITKGLKELAKEFGIVVIALSQLNRNIEHRPEKRPTLSDFRDSGSIEQDADIVLGLQRQSVDKPDLHGERATYADLHILKNRQGRIGRVSLLYQGDQVRFSTWTGPVPIQGSPALAAGRGFHAFVSSR